MNLSRLCDPSSMNTNEPVDELPTFVTNRVQDCYGIVGLLRLLAPDHRDDDRLMVHNVEGVLKDLVSLLVREPSAASRRLEEVVLRLLDRFDPLALFRLLAACCSLSAASAAFCSFRLLAQKRHLSSPPVSDDVTVRARQRCCTSVAALVAVPSQT
jgi:hypothetical protein